MGCDVPLFAIRIWSGGDRGLGCCSETFWLLRRAHKLNNNGRIDLLLLLWTGCVALLVSAHLGKFPHQ